jgi:hypothetical protein
MAVAEKPSRTGRALRTGPCWFEVRCCVCTRQEAAPTRSSLALDAHPPSRPRPCHRAECDGGARCRPRATASSLEALMASPAPCEAAPCEAAPCEAAPCEAAPCEAALSEAALSEAAPSGAPQLRHRSRFVSHPHSGGAGGAHWFFFISRLTAICASRCCSLLPRPISGACAPRGTRGEGFRRAGDFEVVRARDRSRRLEYGVTKTRV